MFFTRAPMICRKYLVNRVAACILALLITSLAPAQNEKLIFSPHWIPQAQFAGYYVALDQGFYKASGLDVQIIHPSASISAFDFLSNGKADIVSSFLMDGIKKRATGVPLVNFAQLSQHSNLMLVTRKTSGISQVKDLDQKKLGIWSSGFDDIPSAFLLENKLKMEIVPVLNTINLFLMDGVDVLTVMYYNEYDQIINSGINADELNTFFFADYGFDIPEDGLYCLESTFNKSPELLRKFVSATLKGWEFAARNKDYTIDLVVSEMKKSHLPCNKAHQSWMLEKVLESISPGNKQVKTGHLSEQDYNRALNILKSGLISEFAGTGLLYENFYKSLAE